mgnify:CR=1 FL=1
MVGTIGLLLLTQAGQLVCAGTPALLETHFHVLGLCVLCPVACGGGVAGAAILRFDLPNPDHERASRFEVADNRVGQGDSSWWLSWVAVIFCLLDQSRSGAPPGKKCLKGRASSTARLTVGRASRRDR